MASASYAVTSFLGGEISDFAQGRFDKPDYKISLNVCLNATPAEIGPWVRRPGTRFAGTTRSGAPGRVIGWAFQQANPITIEFTDGFLCFRAGPQLIPDDSVVVTSISAANPAVVQAARDWPTGSTVEFGFLGTNCPLLQNRQFKTTNIDSTHFSLQDALTGANIDGATLGVSGAVGCTVFLIEEVVTPYTGGAWASLRMVQAETTGIMLQANYAPQALTVTQLPIGQNPVFAFGSATFEDGPYLDPFTNGVQANPSGLTGVVTITLSFPAYVSTTSYAVGDFVSSSSVNYCSLVDQNVGNTPASSPSEWAEVSAGAAINPPPSQPNGVGRGFLGTDVGRLIRMLSDPPLWLAGSTYAEGNVVSYNPTGQPGASTYWQALVSSNTGNIPGADNTNWELVAPGATLPTLPDGTQSLNAGAGPAQWTWGRITGLGNLISGTLSGSANIGNMTGNGGLAAAFNGTPTQNAAASAASSITPGAIGTFQFDVAIGKNYTGASAQAIGSATVYPASDLGFFAIIGGSRPGTTLLTLGFNLRGGATPPPTPADGTFLGTTGLVPVGTQVPVSIASLDSVTTWNYVWIELVASFSIGEGTGAPPTISVFVAQAEFFAPLGTGTSANAVTVELLGPPLLFTAPIITWRLGAYSNTTGWPTCGCYAGGRLWLSGAIANRFDACYANGIVGSDVNFAPTDQYGTVTDAHAIAETFDDDGVNPILWMKPVIQNQQLRAIIMGSQAKEWFVFPPTPGGFAPNNIDSVPATHVGSANVLPCQTEHTFVFVQRYSIKLMEYFADVFSGKYTAPNLADKAQHITRSGIAELAYTYAATPVIWGRCNDGSLFGVTYKRDTLMTAQGPTYYAWHRHQLGSGRVVQSITEGPSVGGNLDALTMVTNATNAADPQFGIRHVEVLTDVLDEDATLAQSWYLDDAVIPTSTVSSPAAVPYGAWAAGTTYAQGQVVTYTDGNAYASLINNNIGNVPSPTSANWLLTSVAPYGGLTLNGLWHLNGEVVAVFAGGLDCGNVIVTSGSAFVPYGDGIAAGTAAGLFTAAFAASGIQIVVGFPYNSDGQLVRPQAPQDAGTRSGPALGKKRRTHKVAALFSNLGMSNVQNQSTLMIGRDFNHLTPVIISPEVVQNCPRMTPLMTFSGVWKDSIADEDSYDGMVCWRIARPLPGNIVVMEPSLEGKDE